MSYEGYSQHICEKGHRFDADVWSKDFCHICGAKSAWSNPVDETNCDGVGYIKPEEFQKLLIKEQVVQECNLGHKHVISEKEYRLPKQGELVRHIRNDNGEYTPLLIHQPNCRWVRSTCMQKCNCNPTVETARVFEFDDENLK